MTLFLPIFKRKTLPFFPYRPIAGRHNSAAPHPPIEGKKRVPQDKRVIYQINNAAFASLPFLSHSRHIAERHILRRSTPAENERQRHNYHNRFSFLAFCRFLIFAPPRRKEENYTMRFCSITNKNKTLLSADRKEKF